MVTPTQLAIIALLLQTEEPLSIREISRRLQKSYPLVYNNLIHLEREKIILKRNIPPVQIITLNEDNAHQSIQEAEREISHRFWLKHKWVRLFMEDVLHYSPTALLTIAIFGSYAKNTFTQSSDLDLLIIVPNHTYDSKTEEALGRSYTPIKKHAVLVTEEEFIEMIKNPIKFNVGNETRKHHIILYGIEQYYQLLREAER